MEIITIGQSKMMVTPDKIGININFQNRSKNYEEALQKGTRSINEFIEQVLIPLGFTKNDLKTNNIGIREEKRYDNNTNTYEIIDYIFQNNSLLEFPYDKDLLTLYLKQVSTLTNPPFFNIDFNLENEEFYKKQLIEKAYQDALEKAEIIANTVNKKIKEILKVSYEPLNQEFSSRTSLNSEQIMYTNYNNIDSFVNYLTPLDIEIEITLNYLFQAE